MVEINALLNIAVRVTTVGAQQLTALQGRLAAMQASAASGNALSGWGTASRAMADFEKAAAGAGGAAGILDDKVEKSRRTLRGFAEGVHNVNNRLGSFGKNLQWTGQQLTMRFTLPIAAGFAIATQAIFANEKEMTRLRKVYDAVDVNDRIKELELLGEIGLALSNKFGIAREEVTATMAAFAQAGAQGTNVANYTRQAIELSILADMELADATQALIVIQQQWRFSNEELYDTIARLNAIENATAVSTEDLLTAIQRAGSTAAAGGVEIHQLGALIAGLVPATGSASQAGNALRSIWTRLATGGKDVQEGIKAVIGAEKVLAFQQATGIGRLNMLAEGWKNLADTEKVYYAGQIAGTFQAGKFLQIMDQMTTAQTAYHVALEKSSDLEAARATYVNELAEAMASDPRQAQIALQQMRNSLAQLVTLAMPTIMQLIGLVSQLVRALNELSPETRKWILIIAVGLAVIGPLVSYVGSLILLFSTLLKPVIAIGRALIWLIPILASASKAVVVFGASFIAAHPVIFLIIAALAAAALAFIFFRDDIMKALTAVRDGVRAVADYIIGIFGLMFTTIVGTVSSGLKAIANLFSTGLKALANFIASAVKVIWELLSYLNPFARHSPSLVEQVDAGIDAIVAKYSELTRIAGPLHQAQRALEDFHAATQGTRTYVEAAKVGEQREAVAKFEPGALPQFDALVQSMRDLEAQLPGLSDEIENQTRVVRELEAALAVLDERIESEERVLSDMEEALRGIGDELSAAKDRLNDYANTPIEGTKAFSDAIFNNEMQIKALRLELLKLEEANPDIEDLTEKFNELNGAIETARGREKELRLAGAGSDILGPLQQQIAQMEAARDAMMNGSAEGPAVDMEALREEIERLEREGERLNLEEALQFDPLRRQIDELVNGMQEMPFDEIVAGIQREQTNVARLTHAYDQQEAAVEQQRQAVEALRDERDLLSKQLDVEQQKLSALEAAYGQIESAINAIGQELANWASLAASAASSAAGAAGELERAVADLEDTFGSGLDGMAGGVDELQALLDGLKEDAAADFESIKQTISDAWDRVKEKFGEVIDYITRPFKETWDSFVNDFAIPLWNFAGEAGRALERVVEWFAALPGKVMNVIATLPEDLIKWGIDMMSGLLANVRYIGGEVIGWFVNFPLELAGIFMDAGSWLIDAGRRIIEGLWWGLGEIWRSVWNWFGGLAGELWAIFKDAGSWLVDAGKRLMEGLYNGIINAPFDIAGAIASKIPGGKRVFDAIAGGSGDALARAIEEENRRSREGGHSGGMVGMDLPQTLHRPYGLRSDEYMRVLRKGETIFTPGQMRALGGAVGGGSNITINGNLEFPNITSGDDAEEFIRNLEALAS